ncbi:MAG: hypothetical protein NZ750_12510 [Anaerolineae bacterium]|nr:hypothetical protein [Anaerolineae bacterium]MDW8173599.1 hypothetical protein [Anaerolineae bacterium]
MRFRLSRFDRIVLGIAALLGLSVLGLALLDEQAEAGPLVAYLAPAYGGLQDLWLAPPDDPSQAQQVTRSDGGLYDFGVSSDGQYIAYSERQQPSGLNEIFLLNLRTRSVTQLTNCVAEDADCRAPRFQPNGDILAYERMTMNTALRSQGVGLGAIRIWVLDLRQTPYQTRPLADSDQFIGHSPLWSRDGNSIAFYSADLANPGILVYQFGNAADKALKFIPSQYGSVGTLSPEGRRLVFPDLTRRGESIYSYLRLADLDALQFVNLTDPAEPIDDADARWSPVGETLVITRRYTDERFTRGYQLYTLDARTGQTSPLVEDARYSHGFFEFNAAGTQIVLQRFPLVSETGDMLNDSRPQIWLKDLQTGELRLLAENAFHPRWVNR